MSVPNHLVKLDTTKAEAEQLLGQKLSEYREQLDNSEADSPEALASRSEDYGVQLVVYTEEPITKQGDDLPDCPEIKTGIYPADSEAKIGEEGDNAVVARVVHKARNKRELSDREDYLLRLVDKELEESVSQEVKELEDCLEPD